MQIGEYKLHSIQTGLFRLDGGAMFGVVPKPLWSKTNPADEKNRIDMCMRALLLVSDNKRILIDNGIGHKTSEKFNEIYGIDHSEYILEKELFKLGILKEDITDVILTHLHFDHAGGSTYYDEEGNLQVTFPNAVHHLQKRHWEWANNPTERDKASFIPENFLLLEKKGNLKLIEGNKNFDDFVELHIINGHTPFQQMVKICDDSNTVLFAADLMPMASHVHIPYIMSYDLYPLTTLEEKKKYLPLASADEWLIFFEHDPFTEACTIGRNEKGFYIKEKKQLKSIESSINA
ncbi:MAG: MBL fold metallo-hydrolase [Ignavibacteriae bacterium]|nr:MAG: MBL fold metallo-hydrolase [Ignavibacteriota bacterium]